MGICVSKQHRPPPWSDLPPELVGLVLCRLLSHADRLSLRAVCRQWRLAIQQDRSLPPALPWIRLGDRTFRSLPGGELRRLKPIGVFRMGTEMSPDGWLIEYEHYNYESRSCFLFNPFTGASMYVPPEPGSGVLHKVVVCSSGLVAAAMNSDTAIGFYRPGAPSWSVSRPLHHYHGGHHRLRSYRDIAFHRGKLYALTDMEELVSHEHVGGNHVDAKVKHVIKEPAPLAGTNRRFQHYLVASCDGRLLMVRWWYPDWIFTKQSLEEKCGAIKLHVFEADLVMGRWVEVKDGLNDQALFIGGNCSKAIRVCANDHRFRGGHVYFLPDHLGLIHPTFRSYLCGSYDLRTNQINQLFLKKKRSTKDTSLLEWFFPSM